MPATKKAAKPAPKKPTAKKAAKPAKTAAPRPRLGIRPVLVAWIKEGAGPVDVEKGAALIEKQFPGARTPAQAMQDVRNVHSLMVAEGSTKRPRLDHVQRDAMAAAVTRCAKENKATVQGIANVCRWILDNEGKEAAPKAAKKPAAKAAKAAPKKAKRDSADDLLA